jgi:hypothetical protein
MSPADRVWSGYPDLNRGPSAPKADALPNCAIPRWIPAASRRGTTGDRCRSRVRRTQRCTLLATSASWSSHPTRMLRAPSRSRVRASGAAGVAQWQSSSLPSWLCGFDPRHPLHTLHPKSDPPSARLDPVAARSCLPTPYRPRLRRPWPGCRGTRAARPWTQLRPALDSKGLRSYVRTSLERSSASGLSEEVCACSSK